MGDILQLSFASAASYVNIPQDEQFKRGKDERIQLVYPSHSLLSTQGFGVLFILLLALQLRSYLEQETFYFFEYYLLLCV